MMRVNPNWQKDIRAKISDGVIVDETLSHNITAKWLISFLSISNTPFKVFNLGAGVKRITTDTDTCPCCKKKL